MSAAHILRDSKRAMPTGTVKFFSHAKRFGFIGSEDGGPDVFVHISTLHRAGLDGLREGDKVFFEVEGDPHQGKIAAVNLLMAGDASETVSARNASSPKRSDSASQRGRPTASDAGSGRGIVKWFNPIKGFGFIVPADGGDDVFVHITAVERSGMSKLITGQSIVYDLVRDRRTGKEGAVNLRIE